MTIKNGDDAPLQTLDRSAQIGPWASEIGARQGQSLAGLEDETVIGEAASQRIKALLRARVGEEVFTSWFNAIEFHAIEAGTVKSSVPQKFLRNWIQSHYVDDLVECCVAELPRAERVVVALRQPGPAVRQPPQAPVAVEPDADVARNPLNASLAVEASLAGRTQAGGVNGSPLDPRLTFETFVVGAANRMAHAAATQVAETIFSEARGFNPLYLHSSVGLGKTHLLHAVAWEVKRRYPHAQLLYLTAERFRTQFVEALQSKDALAFKDRFRNIDILLIDDLEFLHGQHTEQEFDHIINALLDGGRQLVVASSRAPNNIDKLNDRMRSRLQRGLVTEIGAPDYDLRFAILERRVQEKRITDPSFEIQREVLEVIAERLTESGRELEGAATRLHAHWQCMKTQINIEVAEKVIRDLLYGGEPRRIRIEDILKLVSRHYGISRADILSPRRQRSVVWPRQIGMYLAKHLTARSLPEIGRRFGNRDHTTVLHAIRKIEGEIQASTRLRDEIEDLKKLLSH